MPDLLDTDEQGPWVAAWRRAVRATPTAVALSELESTRFLEMSPRAASLLGATPEAIRGLDYLSFAEERASAEQAFRMARDGLLDFVRSRRRLRRMDGSMIELPSWGWAIRSPTGPDLGLWVADDGSGPIDIEDAELADRIRRKSIAQGEVSGKLDQRWDIAELPAQSTEFLRWPPGALLGRPFHSLVLPADRARLLAALARATADSDGATHLRFRQGDGEWKLVRATFVLSAVNGAPVFSFTIVSLEDANGVRVVQLERSLRRIASEVQATGVLTELTGPEEALAQRVTARLSARQLEVISYLLRGERVPTIAREMYVSASTVRNHLVAIFRKFDVHSQQELIDVLRRAQGNDPPVA